MKFDPDIEEEFQILANTFAYIILIVGIISWVYVSIKLLTF